MGPAMEEQLRDRETVDVVVQLLEVVTVAGLAAAAAWGTGRESVPPERTCSHYSVFILAELCC